MSDGATPGVAVDLYWAVIRTAPKQPTEPLQVYIPVIHLAALGCFPESLQLTDLPLKILTGGIQTYHRLERNDSNHVLASGIHIHVPYYKPMGDPPYISSEQGVGL